MSITFIKPPFRNVTVNVKSRHHPHLHDPILKVGRIGGRVYRTLLQFDLTELPWGLPITQAVLYCFFAGDYWEASQTLQLFQVLSRWQPRKVSGCNFPLTAATPLDSFQKSGHNDGFLAFNLTPLVTKWQNQQAANLGVMIKAKEEQAENNLLGFCSSEFRNSAFWPYTEIHYLEDNPHNPLACKHVELLCTVQTSDEMACTNPVNTLCLNYSYLVTNNGYHPAVAYLQISPNGEEWLTQSELYTLQPNQLHAFAANYIAKFSRLCFKSACPGRSTCLTVFVQGISATP